MTAQITALDALIEAVDAGEWNNGIAWRALGVGVTGRAERAFYGSLDAVKVLHDALLPGWGYVVRQSTNCKPCAAVAKYPHAAIYQYAENPARAWLLAILRAYRAQIGGD